MTVSRTFLALVVCFVPAQPLPADQNTSKRPDPADQEYVAAAERLEKSVREGDPTVLKEMFDFEAAIATAIGEIKLSREGERSFRTGLERSRAKGQGLFTLLEKPQNYKLLRVRRVDARPRALFRLLSQQGGVNYHDMMLSRGKDKSIRIVDVYIFLIGENLTDVWRRAVLELAAQENKGLLAKLTGKQSDFVKGLPKVQEMVKFLRAGDFKGAYKSFRELPSSLQKEKGLLVPAVTIASQLDDETHSRVLEEYTKAYPNDPSRDLVCLDGLILKKKYTEAQQAIDRVEKTLGGDPYMNALRANVYLLAEKLSEAKAAARKCMELEPALEDPYWTMLAISLREKAFVETARWLTKIEEDLGIELADPHEIPEYAEFVKSSEYDTWSRACKKSSE